MWGTRWGRAKGVQETRRRQYIWARVSEGEMAKRRLTCLGARLNQARDTFKEKWGILESLYSWLGYDPIMF